MGSRTQRALELCDVLVYRVERPEEAAETVTAALDIVYNGDLTAAVLLAQRLIGAKRWVKSRTTPISIGASIGGQRCAPCSKIAAISCS